MCLLGLESVFKRKSTIMPLRVYIYIEVALRNMYVLHVKVARLHVYCCTPVNILKHWKYIVHVI